MKKIKTKIFIIILGFLSIIAGCTAFKEASMPGHDFGSVSFFITSKNPYQLASDNESLVWSGPVLNTLPFPDHLYLEISNIYISGDGIIYKKIFTGKKRIDLLEDKTKTMGTQVCSYVSTSLKKIAYIKIDITDVLAIKEGIRIDSLKTSIVEKGLPLIPLSLNPDKVSPIYIEPARKTDIIINFDLLSVLSEDTVKNQYSVSDKPVISVTSEAGRGGGSISGTVIKSKDINGTIMVAAFLENKLIISNKSPDFACIANSKGKFKFEYLPDNTYYLSAFVDVNLNGRYDVGIDAGPETNPVPIKIIGSNNIEGVMLSVKIDNLPQAPILSIQDKGPDYITLKWTRNSEADFKSYKIYRQTEMYITPERTKLIAEINDRNTTSYTDENLKSDTVYYYIVEATDTTGLSKASNEISAKTKINLEILESYPLKTLQEPRGILFFENKFYITDTAQKKFYIFNENLFPQLTYNWPILTAEITDLTSDGFEIWGIDMMQKKIYEFNKDFSVRNTYNAPGDAPSGIAYDGTFLWTSDIMNNKIYRLNNDEMLSIAREYNISFEYPPGKPHLPVSPNATSMTFKEGKLWITDLGTNKIHILKLVKEPYKGLIKEYLTLETSFTYPGLLPAGVTQKKSSIYTTDLGAFRVYKHATPSN